VLGENWLEGSTLELGGEHEAEWDRFRQLLIESGISLQERSDVFMWTRGDNTGKLTVKNAYNALAAKFWENLEETWWKKLWKWDCPIKIRLFIWLLSANKILVWENLQARGWAGPSRCALCKSDCESVHHLFVKCPFTCAVWKQVLLSLKISPRWTGASVSSCFNNWQTSPNSYPSLPAILCWNIWTDRNEAIFDEGCPSTHRVVYKTIAAVATLGT